MEWSQPQDVNQLIVKKNGKELDPKFFDPRESRKFNESDRRRMGPVDQSQGHDHPAGTCGSQC